jgi:hypothetical protein
VPAAADPPPLRPRATRRATEESTFRRAFALLGPGRLDQALGTWLHTSAAQVVYLITSDRDAGPVTLAAWIRGHQEIENKLHWVRDVTYREDKSLVRTGNAPRVMASLRSLAISLLRLDSHASIAAANRHHARDPQFTLNYFRPHERLCRVPGAYAGLLAGMAGCRLAW